MRRLLLLAPLALAACETPREACQNDALRELRVIDALIAETEGNLRRGFALEEVQEVRVREDTCEVELPDGSEARVECEDTDVVTRQRPVAIDLRAEARELDSLRERRGALNAALAPRLQACQALPDE